MFNAEQLLGTIVKEMVGGKKSKKKRKSGLMNSLTSGAGLMTAIGLGVGAYEIFMSKQKNAAPMPGQPPMPPPVPPVPSAVATPPPPPPAATAQLPAAENDAQQLAIRMIQVMAAAAHADGQLDEAEETRILERLRASEIGQEERLFVLDQLRHPKTIAELCQGIDDPAIARAMYLCALQAIDLDSEQERQWLDDLADGLQLSRAVQRFLEQEA